MFSLSLVQTRATRCDTFKQLCVLRCVVQALIVSSGAPTERFIPVDVYSEGQSPQKFGFGSNENLAEFSSAKYKFKISKQWKFSFSNGQICRSQYEKGSVVFP